ncbi:MAG: hypothetical protein QME68_06435, partial [Elusimicrobiota bacterium]|nr:hypothetical protein [Elusimicrobiota bacterium]
MAALMRRYVGDIGWVTRARSTVMAERFVKGNPFNLLWLGITKSSRTERNLLLKCYFEMKLPLAVGVLVFSLTLLFIPAITFTPLSIFQWGMFAIALNSFILGPFFVYLTSKKVSNFPLVKRFTASKEAAQSGISAPNTYTKKISLFNQAFVGAVTVAVSGAISGAIITFLLSSNPIGWVIGGIIGTILGLRYFRYAWFIAKAGLETGPTEIRDAKGLTGFITKLSYIITNLRSDKFTPAKVVDGKIHINLKLLLRLPKWLQKTIYQHEQRHIEFAKNHQTLAKIPLLEEIVVSLGNIPIEFILMSEAPKENLLKQAEIEINNYLDTQYHEKKITEEIYKKARDVTYKNLEFWATDKYIKKLSPKTQKAIYEAIRQKRWKDIVEVFRQDITFGTAGIRGLAALTKKELYRLKKQGPSAGILKGPNTINDIVLLRYTAGVARYMKQKGLHKVAIGYDSRIAGQQFAEMIAKCFLGLSTEDHKFTVYLFDEASPFPELSFGLTTKPVRADIGILISASHNPAQYNGYKITDRTGAQLPPSMQKEIKSAIAEITTLENINLKPLEEAEEGQLIWLGGKEPIKGKDYKGVDLTKHFIDMHTLHVEQVKKFILDKELLNRQAKNVRIGFSAFNGAGNKAVPRLLSELGFLKVKVIKKLQELNGLFPAFGWGEQPDPGDPISADIAVKEFIAEHGKKSFDELDILIGTDPDADRLGLIVKVPESQQRLFGKYRLLSANDVWTLLTWYRLMKKKELGLLTDPANHYITFSHVTTDALEATANLFGVRSLGEMLDKNEKEERGGYLNGRRTWVGFTYIAKLCNKMRKLGLINEGGAEESNGYSILGSNIREGEVLADDAHVNDKDGTFAAVLVAEVACYAKENNTTIFELLDNIYLQIGHYATANKPLP